MSNVPPAPYGLVTCRWTRLSDDDRDAHALRLVGTTAAKARIGEPEGAARYGRLVEAAATGDPEAIAWLAWSHRPKLAHRGHDLYRADPAEWGSVCLEILYSTVRQAVAADVTSSRWCRRWMVQRMCAQLARHARTECDRVRRERTCTMVHLDTASASRRWVGPGGGMRPGPSAGRRLEESPPHGFAAAVTPELRDALIEALAQVDVAAREALVALADDGSPGQLQAIADRHHISAAALRQRLHRARRRLQPQLAGWMVAA